MKTTRFTLISTWIAALLAGTAVAAEKHHSVLVEAESFADRGGWVVDQQYMDQMGSPVLLAHGMGEPVTDAKTTVTFPAAGEYRVLVRTRDWTAPWKTAGKKWESPGRFQLLVDGQPLKTTFGIEGAEWHWQQGGTIRVGEKKVTLALRDLTGFDGRCDAILFTTDPKLLPPNAGKAMTQFRRELLGLPEKPAEAGEFDLVVVGGGMAGTCAAVSAARLGLTVALIQDRPVLGGNNSSEIRVHLGGNIRQQPYPAIGGVVAELDSKKGGNAQPAAYYADDKKQKVVEAEKNIRLFLNTHVSKVEKVGERIVAVVGKDIVTGKESRFAGRLFADCTGDGTVGYLAGADYRYGRESRAETGESLAVEKPDRQTMGTSVMWYSAVTEEPTKFPECPWAIQFTEKTYQKATAGNWNWETGFRQDQITDFEKVRDHGLRAVYGNWAFQKNQAKDKDNYANRKLGWVAYVGGKRESRRLLGDVILRQQDVDELKPYPDASVTTTWTIDLHYPIQSEHFPGEEFRSEAKFHKTKPYAIPYRCLYSRNVPNLFMAGRHVSVTHVALGTIRVMRTTGMMGEVVGMAAAVCKKHSSDPRDVYAKYLDELKELMTRGVGKPVAETGAATAAPPPAWLKTAGPSLARTAKVAVSGCLNEKQYPPSMINDGRIDVRDNKLRWVSDTNLPHTVELTWEKPQTIGAARIVTGQAGGADGPSTPITDFVLQYRDGQQWKDVPGTKTEGNEACDWHAKFPAVEARQVRLLVTAAPGDLTRIWELELYPPLAEK